MGDTEANTEASIDLLVARCGFRSTKSHDHIPTQIAGAVRHYIAPFTLHVKKKRHLMEHQLKNLNLIKFLTAINLKILNFKSFVHRGVEKRFFSHICWHFTAR